MKMSPKWCVVAGVVVIAIIAFAAFAASPKPMRTPEQQAVVEASLKAAEQMAVDAIAMAATTGKRQVIAGDKPVVTIPGAVKMLRPDPDKLSSYELRLYDTSGKRLTAPANAFGYMIFAEPVKGLTIKSIPDLAPEGTTPTGRVGQVEAWIAS